MSSDEERVEKKEDSGIQIIYVLKLLRRSNFYANLILAAIERKQKKREQKLESKLLRHELEAKRQQVVETFIAQSTGSSPDIKLEVCQIMDDMLDEVVKDFELDSDDEDFNHSISGSEFSQNSTFDSLLGLNTSPLFDDFDDFDDEAEEYSEEEEEEEEPEEEEPEEEEYMEIDDDYVVEELDFEHNPRIMGEIPTEEEYLEQLRIRRERDEAMPPRTDKISKKMWDARRAEQEAKEDQFNYGEKKEEPGKLAEILLDMQRQDVKSEAGDSVTEINVKNETSEEIKCKSEALESRLVTEACVKSPAVRDVDMKDATLSDSNCGSEYSDKVKTEICENEIKAPFSFRNSEVVVEKIESVCGSLGEEVGIEPSQDEITDPLSSDKCESNMDELISNVKIEHQVVDPLCSEKYPNKMDEETALSINEGKVNLSPKAASALSVQVPPKCDDAAVGQQKESSENLFSALPAKVACPVCEKMFKITTLDKHLDICTLKSEKKSSLRGRSDAGEVSLPKKCRRLNKKEAPVKIVSSGKESLITGEAIVKNDKVKIEADFLNQNKTASKQMEGKTTTVERRRAVAVKCHTEEDKHMSKAYKTVLSGMQHLKNAMQKTIQSNNALASEKLKENAAAVLLQEETAKKALEEEKKKKAVTRKRKAKNYKGGNSKRKKQNKMEEISIVKVTEESSQESATKVPGSSQDEKDPSKSSSQDSKEKNTKRISKRNKQNKMEEISITKVSEESSQESAAKVPGSSQDEKDPSKSFPQDCGAKEKNTRRISKRNKQNKMEENSITKVTEGSPSQESAAKVPGCSQNEKDPSNSFPQDCGAKEKNTKRISKRNKQNKMEEISIAKVSEESSQEFAAKVPGSSQDEKDPSNSFPQDCSSKEKNTKRISKRNKQNKMEEISIAKVSEESSQEFAAKVPGSSQDEKDPSKSFPQDCGAKEKNAKRISKRKKQNKMEETSIAKVTEDSLQESAAKVPGCSQIEKDPSKSFPQDCSSKEKNTKRISKRKKQNKMEETSIAKVTEESSQESAAKVPGCSQIEKDPSKSFPQDCSSKEKNTKRISKRKKQNKMEETSITKVTEESSQESAANVPGSSQNEKVPSNSSSQDSNAKVPGNSQDVCGRMESSDHESFKGSMDDMKEKNNSKEICSVNSTEQDEEEKETEKEPEAALPNVGRKKEVVNKNVADQKEETVKEDVKKLKVSRRSRKSQKDFDSDSEDNIVDEDEEEDEDEESALPVIPSAPTRRSSRAAAKVSYTDLLNSSDDDEEDEQNDPEQEVPKKRKKKVQMKPEIAYKQAKLKAKRRMKKDDGDDDYKPDEKDADDKDEEEEDEPTIDVEALIAKKFYFPDKEHQLPRKNRAEKFEKMKNPNPGQPKIFTGGVLRDYQVTGFQWLKILFENGENGILADEMGLGKTIQCIAMICKLVQSGVSGPHLVISPTTTLANWYSEFQRFAPAIPVVFYYGNCEERSYLIKRFIHEVDELNNRDYVLITSYEIMMRDRSVLTTFNWGYMVMDEAHRAKNFASQTLIELRRFLVKNKVLLTGTPLQNNLGELWTLLNFLFPDIFDEMRAFRHFFDFDLLCKDDKVLNMLHQVLTPFLLRRTKNDVDVKIPPKREILVMVPMATLQQQYYEAIVDKSIRRLLQNEAYYDETPGVADPDPKGKKKKNKRELRDMIEKSTKKEEEVKTEIQFGDAVINVTMNNMMMQLRKCCNHPYLISYPLIPGTDDLRIDEDIVNSCGKMMLLARMLPQLKERGHKVLLYSQMTSMLDILEEYCNMRDISFVRFDGSTPCDQRFSSIDRFNTDESIFLFLLSTRAGGLGVNLTAADTVIIYDSDWNPQNDMQAQDRCHRIGQSRPVVIYRFVAANTVDHKIVQRAAEKRVLENVIMHKGKFKGNLKNDLKDKNSTTSQKLLTILKETNKSVNVVTSSSDVISEKRLQQLLDRSDMTSSAPRTQADGDVTPGNGGGSSNCSQEEGTSPQAKFKVILNSVADENVCVT